MKYIWKDLPKRLNCFTVRNARMVNLDTGKIVSNFAANTKIAVVQKCVTPTKTWYRTQEAAHHQLNYAFEASAFGLPNEKAPSAPSSKVNSLNKSTTNKNSKSRKPSSTNKIKKKPIMDTSKDGERVVQKPAKKEGLFRRIKKWLAN